MNLTRALRLATTEGVPRRSLIIAAVVGTVLNLINQGDVLMGAGPVNWLKLGLTYIVPYCVSTYGAVSYRLSVGENRDAGDGRRDRA